MGHVHGAYRGRWARAWGYSTIAIQAKNPILQPPNLTLELVYVEGLGAQEGWRRTARDAVTAEDKVVNKDWEAGGYICCTECNNTRVIIVAGIISLIGTR